MVPNPQPVTVRRLQLTLKRPMLSLYGWLKPTVVIDGRGYPGQWGTGTWQVPSEGATVVGVYLYNRLWKFGQAEYRLDPGQPAVLEYRPHALWPGNLRPPR